MAKTWLCSAEENKLDFLSGPGHLTGERWGTDGTVQKELLPHKHIQDISGSLVQNALKNQTLCRVVSYFEAVPNCEQRIAKLRTGPILDNCGTFLNNPCAAPQDRGRHFARACAVAMHINMSQEQFMQKFTGKMPRPHGPTAATQTLCVPAQSKWRSKCRGPGWAPTFCQPLHGFPPQVHVEGRRQVSTLSLQK